VVSPNDTPDDVKAAEVSEWMINGPGSINRYKIIRELGRGGMGIVYLARDPALGREVALKVLPRGAASARGRDRFRLEAEASAGLSHPNIVSIHDFGTYLDMYYYTMDYIKGKSLDDVKKGGLSPVLAAEVIEQTARAVEYAHSKGIIHRDLKPGNIFIDESGTVKVLDFGLAKIREVHAEEHGAPGEQKHNLTEDGIVVGTPLYMSPEQASGHTAAVDERTDIYAMGAILYELFTGSPPFVHANQYELLSMIIQDEVVPPSKKGARVHPDLETICLKCLEKDPHRRYHTAGELARDLHAFLTGEPIKARPVSGMARIVRKVRRHSNILAVAALGIAAVAGVFIYHTGRMQKMIETTEEKRRFAWQTVYEQEFNGEGIPPDWVPGGGKWWVDNGTLAGTGTGNCFIVLKTPFPGDVRVEMTARSQGGEVAMFILGTEENALDAGYFLSMRTGAGKISRAGATLLADSSLSIESGVPHKFIAERFGSLVKIYLEENPSIGMELDDPSPLGDRKHAYVGIYTYAGSIAVDSFRVCRVSWPEETSPLMLAQKLLSKGEYELAIEEFADIASTSRDPEIAAQGLFWAAKSVEMSGELSMAVKYYTELRQHPALDLFPAIKEEALFRTIRCYFATGHDDKAEPLLEEAMQMYPKANSWRVLAAYAMGEAVSSKLKLQTTLKALPANQAAEIRNQLGDTPIWKPWLEKAEEYVSHVADENLAGSLRRALARSYMEMGGDEGYITHALELDPGNPLLLIHLADILLNKDDIEQAEKAAEAALKAAPNTKEPHAELARIAIAKRDYARAEALLRTAVKLDPYFETGESQLGDVLLLADKPDEAIAVLKKKADEGVLTAVRPVLYSLYELGRTDEAEVLMLKTLNLLESTQPALDSIHAFEGWTGLILPAMEMYLRTSNVPTRAKLLESMTFLVKRMEELADRRKALLRLLDGLKGKTVDWLTAENVEGVLSLDEFDRLHLQRIHAGSKPPELKEK
jgi:tetratricopeptide (TPR) repeat protein/predicted Ser/Thr protein kinase